MDAEEARTIGRRVRQIRHARGRSLRVVAGLAGMSRSHLSRIERGERFLDSRSQTAALANALGIAPSELTRVQEPTAGNGEGEAVKAVRRALMAVSRDDPAGQVVPVEELHDRTARLLAAQRECRFDQVGLELPSVIRDLHSSLASGRDVGELLAMAVLLHVQGTHAFLSDMEAPPDLRWQASTLARNAAREHGAAELLGLSAFGAANGLLAFGEFDVALAEIDSVTVPTSTPQGEQLDGMLALSRSLVAAAAARTADVHPPLEHAVELARRTEGQEDAFWLGFGSANVGVWRMAVTLEARDFAQAATIAEEVRPELLPNATRKATYWANYGRALARLRGRQDDAVLALRKAELISPERLQRHPFVRDTLAELVAHSRRDAVGRELRGMAYRAGLPL